MVGTSLRRSLLVLVIILAGALLAMPAPACPFCSMQGQTLTADVNQASMVLFGTLANAKLYEDVEDALRRQVDLNRQKDDFVAAVSHELRTPLTAIITFVETLEGGADEDAANSRRFLSVIRRNAERMHVLINDILELSAIEAGTVAVETRDVRLASLVAECFTALASRAGERRVSLRNEVGPEVLVRADARRLEQMLTNLVDNAVKFNREGGEVVVAYERGGGRDRVTVHDTGEGIAPEHLPRIFERFYRVDRARSRALGGTGLGLAIVKHLARAHGGEAAVRSTPGEGSTFTIELPIKQES